MSEFLGRADLERRCVQPGWWWVEGVQLRKDHGVWTIIWEPTVHTEPVDSFNDGLNRIAEAINHGTFDAKTSWQEKERNSRPSDKVQPSPQPQS